MSSKFAIYSLEASSAKLKPKVGCKLKEIKNTFL